MGETTKKKAGYEYLLAYKISVPLYDYTVLFCRKYFHLLSSTRTVDQMVQASRSGNTNIPEGNQQASLEGYIKLTGVSAASLEELLKDYFSFARQNKIEIWEKEEVAMRVREVGEVWITLTNQAIYLQKKLKASLEEKFVATGGFRENLFKKRMERKRRGVV